MVVTTADASSLRDAQHTVMELDRFPAGALHLVVNRVRKKLLRQLHATIDDAIDKAGLPLLGVVPEDDAPAPVYEPGVCPSCWRTARAPRLPTATLRNASRGNGSPCCGSDRERSLS